MRNRLGNMKAVSVKNLTFEYSGDNGFSLKDVSFDVNSGEILLIIGESGSGKTTLLRHLKPAYTPEGLSSSDGVIELCGKPVDHLTEQEAAFRIGYVGQQVEESQVTDKVWHELAFGLESMGCDQNYMHRRLAEITTFFGLEEVYHQKLSELSGGQKQLVNLAAVMIMEPELLLLDEPTSQLDPSSSLEFFHMIRRIHEELGTTIIITEHRLEDILPMADKVMVLDRGRVMMIDVPGAVCSFLYEGKLPLFRSMPVAVRIYYGLGGACGPADKHCESEERKVPLSVNEGRSFLSDYMNGDYGLVRSQRACADRTSVSRKSAASKCDLVIEVDEIWFRYKKDGSDVIKACSFNVEKGRITSILGGNGVGKSTLLSVLAGNLSPYMGKLKRSGVSIGYLPQNPQAMFAEKTVRKELESSGSSGYEEVMEFFELSECLDKHPFDLSGGQMEKLALSKLVLAGCDVFLLDEPGKGMDYAFKEKLGMYLRSLCEQGKTVLLVSHDVEFCSKYSDVCGMFFDGHIVAVDDTRTIFLQNTFFTTAVRRMCRGLIDAVTVEDVLDYLGADDRDTYNDDEADNENRTNIEEKNEAYASQKEYCDSDALGESVKMSESINEYGNKNDEVTVDYKKTQEQENTVDVRVERKETKNRGERNIVYTYVVPCLVFLVLMPLTIYIGYAVLHQRKYYFISIMLIIEAVGTMLVGYEGRKPGLKELMTVAVLSAITALSRAMFYMVPAVKPMAALTIISGVGLGGVSGFVVGALSMLVSDIFFSQGPWTPWQMFTMGLLGYLAGIIFHRKYYAPGTNAAQSEGTSKRRKLTICIYGLLSVLFIYGGIMNPASVLMYQENVTWQMLLASYAPGIPIDIIHCVATFIFLWFLTEPMLEKLERVRRK